MDKITDLENRIIELERIIKSLGSSTTIPKSIGDAFTVRLKPVSGDTSSTSTAPYIQAVNEAGVATYSVAKPMAGFVTIVVNGNSRIVPYY